MARTTRNSTVMQGCVQEYLGGSDAPLESLRTAPPMLVASCLAHNLMMDAPPNLQDAGAIDACGLLRKEQALRRITKLMAVLKLPPKAVAMAHLNALCCGGTWSMSKPHAVTLSLMMRDNKVDGSVCAGKLTQLCRALGSPDDYLTTTEWQTVHDKLEAVHATLGNSFVEHFGFMSVTVFPLTILCTTAPGLTGRVSMDTVRSLIKDFTDMQATVRAKSDAKECTCPTHMCCTAHA